MARIEVESRGRAFMNNQNTRFQSPESNSPQDNRFNYQYQQGDRLENEEQYRGNQRENPRLEERQDQREYRREPREELVIA